jgi:ferritin-like metal-binding protein YciE
MPKRPKQLDGLFHEWLKVMYFAEKRILTALPEMAKAARNEKLKAAFDKHERETADQVSRLEQIFVLTGKKAQAGNSPAITAMIEECEEIVGEYNDSPALDAGLVAAAQAIGHYAIARHGALRNFAHELGMTEAVRLLDKILDEEEDADDALFDLTEILVNWKAPQDEAA